MHRVQCSGNHIQAPNIFLELGRKHSGSNRVMQTSASAATADTGWRTDHDNPQLRFHYAAGVTMASCAVLYSLTGVFGYLSCGSVTKGDILLSYPVSDAITAIARVLMAVHVILALPVVVLPCRKAIFMLWFFVHARCIKRSLPPTSSAQNSASTAGISSGSERKPRTRTTVPAVDPHADVVQLYLSLEEDTRLVCGMGCTVRHLAWNAALVIGPALVAVAVPKVQVCIICSICAAI
jgi:hypothetical protein